MDGGEIAFIPLRAEKDPDAKMRVIAHDVLVVTGGISPSLDYRARVLSAVDVFSRLLPVRRNLRLILRIVAPVFGIVQVLGPVVGTAQSLVDTLT